jgi:hypothetical protein
MSKDDTYFLHQTPSYLAKDLISNISLLSGDVVIDPFMGEGAFYNHYPPYVKKEWAEILQGRDYKSISCEFDWVITNPPVRLDFDLDGKRYNSFWGLLDYYSKRARKGIAFLTNDKCFQTLTPRRLSILQSRGFSLNKIIVCSVSKWRGRYFFCIFQKTPTDFFCFLRDSY